MSEENGTNGNGSKLPVQVGSHGAIVRSVEDAYRIGSGIVQSNLFSKKFKTPQQAMIAILTGRELGLGPIASCRGVNVIEGQPALSGDLQLSLARNSGKMANFKRWYTGTENEDDWTCHVSSKRVDDDESVEHTFSVADAKRAGLWGAKSSTGKPLPWSMYPARMMYYRALAFHLRDQYGDVLMGTLAAEEVNDYPEPDRQPFDPSEVHTPAEEDELLNEAMSGESEPAVVEGEVVEEQATAEQEAAQ